MGQGAKTGNLTGRMTWGSALWLMAVVLLARPLYAQQDAELSQRLLAQVERWQAQAEQGSAEAQYNLGQFFRKGVGMPPEPARARLYYEQAAAQGHLMAQLNLGTLCYFAVDAQPDLECARHWWRAAAEQGEPRAAYRLGVLYLQQPEPDRAAAQVWLQKARSRGHEQAALALRQWVEGEYTAQLGSFSERAAAEAAVQALSADLGSMTTEHPLSITSVMAQGQPHYRVQLGDFTDKDQARELCSRIQRRVTGQGCFPARKP